MKPIQGSNNNVHNKDINNAELTNSEIVLFDERSDHPVNHNRIKPTSPLESFKAMEKYSTAIDRMGSIA